MVLMNSTLLITNQGVHLKRLHTNKVHVIKKINFFK